MAGGAWLAVGDPVGVPADAAELVWRLREASARCGARAVYVGVAAGRLPLYVPLGYRLLKLGEAAVVTSPGPGPAADGVTAAHEAAGALGGRIRVDVVRPSVRRPGCVRGSAVGASLLDGAPPAAGGDLRVVARRAGRAVAVLGARHVSGDAEVVAEHAWTAPGVSLPMAARLHALVVSELIAWAARERIARVDLSVATLAGLARHRLAPVLTRLASWVHDRRGRRAPLPGRSAWREGFAATWEPRYLAVPGAASLPATVLAMRAVAVRRTARLGQE